jgi:hypothetical protein
MTVNVLQSFAIAGGTGVSLFGLKGEPVRIAHSV